MESDLARRLKNVEILLRPDLGVNLVSLSESSGPVGAGFFPLLGVLTAMLGAVAGLSPFVWFREVLRRRVRGAF